MGNVLLRGGIDRRRRRIKIMKADGTVMKLRSPVSVKEILIDYPNHEIFEAPAGPRLGMGSFTRPLPERAGLVAGHLYYLIPLPLPQDQLINYNNNSNRRPFARASSYHSIPSASSRLQPPSSADMGRDSIKQEEADDRVVNKIKGGVRIVSSSYSTDGSTVRVKLRLRKEELASFLSANNVNVVMENVLVPPLIQRATRQSALSPWKPRLDTIAELHSPLGDL
jgi:hypothetical protein